MKRFFSVLGLLAVVGALVTIEGKREVKASPTPNVTRTVINTVTPQLLTFACEPVSCLSFKFWDSQNASLQVGGQPGQFGTTYGPNQVATVVKTNQMLPTFGFKLDKMVQMGTGCPGGGTATRSFAIQVNNLQIYCRAVDGVCGAPAIWIDECDDPQ